MTAMPWLAFVSFLGVVIVLAGLIDNYVQYHEARKRALESLDELKSTLDTISNRRDV